MILLPAGNASEWTGPTGNNTWLVPGPRALLVDAGVGDPAHLDDLERALDGTPLEVVLLTHGHVDHAGGVPAVRTRWPGVTVRGGGIGPPIEDHELFDTGEFVLRAIHTPGHSPDHFCFLDLRTREVLCGDLARLGGTVVIPASRGGDLDHYLASLRRIRDIRPRRLLPAHGPVVDDPVGLIDAYLAHRAERDRQIVAAIARGCRTVDEIVAAVYPRLSPRLTGAAAETVRAHLKHLEVHGIDRGTA